ncbi:MAG TPA: sigma 54-interacting transcriptional regulator [Symbiobacteriaceae bacterium]|nr:sigma 54-interacting transcriptional regulator [Symbiobacteriaceae bacterium]
MGDLSRQWIAALLDGLSEAVLVADGSGKIVLVNRAMEEVLRRQRGELVGHSAAALEADGLWLPPALRRCLASGQRETLIQEVGGRRLVLAAGPLPGGLVLASARDITELDRLQRQAERAQQERERCRSELTGLRKDAAAVGSPVEVVGTGKTMQKVLGLVRRIAAVDSTILLLGESGSGKGVLARTIHRWSPRVGAAFVRVDCAAIPESLLESELFGYAPGSFTGARREGKAGIVEQAHGGTLFLDEIGDLSPSLQAKLLHLIQERQFTRVGAVAPQWVDVRIIAATHQDLERLVAEGRFRRDLFYRLNVVPITLPPLREHLEDVPALARAFLANCCTRYGVTRVLAPETLDCLVSYGWPGNVRELENVIERLVVTAEAESIAPEHLPPALQRSMPATRPPMPLAKALEAVELDLIASAYAEHGSSVKVARVLGIHQTTAARKIREWKERQG